jgi:hypothetical protein
MKQWWAQQLDGLEDVSFVSRLAIKIIRRLKSKQIMKKLPNCIIALSLHLERKI